MIKFLIIDDHAIVRQGLKQILADIPDLVVAGGASNGQEALEMVRAGHWDIVVLDISLPGPNGLVVLRQLKSRYPRLPVLVFSMHTEEQYTVRVLKAGAAGYLTKESAPEQLITAIRKVASGGKYVSPALRTGLVK